jgi:hypothetical protein
MNVRDFGVIFKNLSNTVFAAFFSPKWNISAPSIERRRVRVVSVPGGGYSSPIFSLHRRPFKSALLYIILCSKQTHAMSKNIH